MSYTFKKSEELYQRALNSIPGGVNSGIRKLEQPVPLYFERGSGSRLMDVDGNEYIDCQIGQGAILFGHAPHGLAQAIANQAFKGTHWAAQSEMEIQVAELVRELVPSVERVRFNNSATECVLAAFRLARAHTGRRYILKFEGHYHGWADEGLVSFASAPDQWGSELEPSRTHPSQGIIAEVMDQFIICPWNNIKSFSHLTEKYKGQIAAVVFEPLLCNTCCIEPVADFISTIRSVCDQQQILMIADETITGFRLSAAGAQGYYGFHPDLTIFGKAIGGGVPFAAFGGKAEVMETLNKGKVVHAGTLNANSLCLAASLWCLQLVKSQKSEYPDRLHRFGKMVMSALVDLGEKYGIRFRPQGPGAAFHSVILKEGVAEGAILNYRDYVERHDAAQWTKIRKLFLEEGLRVIERGLWFMSLAHTEKDIQEIIIKADRALARMKGD